MENIVNSIENLQNYLKLQTTDYLDWDKTEALTGKVIINDSYELLSQEIQDMIELFDSPELNNPNENDRQKILSLLDEYLKS